MDGWILYISLSRLQDLIYHGAYVYAVTDLLDMVIIKQHHISHDVSLTTFSFLGSANLYGEIRA